MSIAQKLLIGAVCLVAPCTASQESVDQTVPDAPDEAGFVAIFDGETLDGWVKRGGGATYVVENESIVGAVGPGRNTFLCTEKEYADFELRLEFRFDVPGNSGIQFRSHVNEDGIVFGYQCEIDPSDRAWTCGVYDESRRGWLFPLKDMPQSQQALKKDDWNTVRIRAVGDHIQTWLNDVPCADFHDDADASGFIALQVHSGSKGQLRWRNIRILEIRAPGNEKKKKIQRGGAENAEEETEKEKEKEEKEGGGGHPSARIVFGGGAGGES